MQASAAALIEIDSCAELQAMSGDLAAAYRLSGDVDCTGFDAGDGGGFLPIGDTNTAFTGTFDGAGHLITGLTINRPSEFGVALFMIRC